jgi:hypothetical protein
MEGTFNPRDISHIDKFNGTNFQQWKYGISLILDQYEIKDIAEAIKSHEQYSLKKQKHVNKSHIMFTGH